MKTCAKCGLVKDVSEFYSDASHRDGLTSSCKACVNERRAIYRESNREKLKLQARSDRRSVPERGCWQAMLARCYDERNSHYEYYGGRGIQVCRRWRESFDAFLADMGQRPSLAHTVDRKDTNGNYEPDNCRWATPKQQGRNSRRNRLLTAFGKTQCLAAWAEETGIPSITIRDRIRHGFGVEEALSAPRIARGERHKRSA